MLKIQTNYKFTNKKNALMHELSKPHIQSVKKFYFLEYFYVLLRSVDKYSDSQKIFNAFKRLKQEYRLGESKYKTLTSDTDNLTKVQLDRYRYTFEQVIEEAKEYNLIEKDNNNGDLLITEDGKKLLTLYHKKGIEKFNRSLFGLMESKYNAFFYLIEFLYNANKYKPGLLIFPNYSPRQLLFEKNNVKTTADIYEYADALVHKIQQQDISLYLGQEKNLDNEKTKLLNRLIDTKLLSSRIQIMHNFYLKNIMLLLKDLEIFG